MLSSECIKNTNSYVGNCWKNIEKTPNKNSAIESKENNKTVHWRWMTFLSPLFFVHLALVTYRVIWACVFCVFFSSAFFLQSFIFKLIRSEWNIARVANERERKNSIKHLIQRKFLSNVLINSAFVTSASSKFAHYAHCRPRMPTNGVEVSALCLSFMIHLILMYWGSVCSAYYAVSYALDFHFLFRSVFL